MLAMGSVKSPLQVPVRFWLVLKLKLLLTALKSKLIHVKKPIKRLRENWCQQQFLSVASTRTTSVKLKDSFLRHSKTSIAVSRVLVQSWMLKDGLFQIGYKVIAGDGTKGTILVLLVIAVFFAKYF